jgi:acetyl esterase/lipase
LGLILVVALLVGGGWWWLHPAFERTAGVVYTRSKGRELSFDVLRPAHPNGAGVVVMVSGRWQSRRGAIADIVMAPLLRRGYTLLAVTHGSQPEFTVMDIARDVQRAVRFIRNHARSYGIDPNRLGVTGGSSGGHLGLMLATCGGPGPANAADPVERESSAVQAAAVFYPVTDLLNLGASTDNPGDGGPPKSFVKAFGPDSTNLAVWKIIGREMSPIYHVSSNLPPVLIIHGGADTLVPLDQSERFAQRVRQLT